MEVGIYTYIYAYLNWKYFPSNWEWSKILQLKDTAGVKERSSKLYKCDFKWVRHL